MHAPPETEVRSDPAPARPPIQAASAQPLLDPYIPKELMSKLEAARAQGGMVGERRIVTMLFCDMKGSTAAAQNLDPEDWTEIINGAFEYMIKPVYKYEGIVARLMGDGILAFFGAPIAHEDDPQRAVLTGLDIVSGMAPYREKIRQAWNIDVNVRVGINTGLVVVGAVGSDLRLEYTAMGDAINLAARMEQTATPGTIQITQDTYKLVAPLFELEALGGIEVKGKDEPVPAYKVLGRKASPGRVRGIEGLETDLVGRSQEMARLESVLTDLDRGIGRIVCLIGGAGLGKSRLIRELKQVNTEGAALNWIETASLSYETTYPYALFQQLIRRLNGISASEETTQFWDKIHGLTSQLPPEKEKRYKRVFAALFSIPDPSGQLPLEGEHFKNALYSAMQEIWKIRFNSQPTMLVLDDLHWADPASIDLLIHLLSTVENNPVVLLCAFRPDRNAPSYRIKQTADGQHHHLYTEINLRPLSEKQSNDLVNGLLSIADLPDSMRVRIQERSGGNPFFVEEVVRTLIEKGAVVSEDRPENGTVQRYWRATSDSASIDIPDSLQGLLASRIDRLEDDTRQIMQLASVIGRTFYHRILSELGKGDALTVHSVEDQIGRLVRLEMIQEAARVPEVEYKFRNPLTQEIAYQTILLKQRRVFHGQVGKAIETLFPDQLTELAPRLAFHFSEAKEAEKALDYYMMAGESAFRLFAIAEALNNYEQALQWAERGEASSEQYINIYRRRARALELSLRFDEALETYQALEALGETQKNDKLRLAGIVGQSITYVVGQRDLENSRKRGEEALALAQKLGDRRTEAQSLWSLLLALTWMNPAQALAYGEQGLVIARELNSLEEASNEDLEQLALILMDLSYPQLAKGNIQLAKEQTFEAQKIFNRIGNLPMTSTASTRSAQILAVEGHFEEALAAVNQSITIDKNIGNEGGLLGSYLGKLEILPRTGDFEGFFNLIEDARQLGGQDEIMTDVFLDMYQIAGYFYLEAFDKIREALPVLRMYENDGFTVWKNVFISYAGMALIEAGDLEVGKEFIDKSSTGFEMDNYLLPVFWNVLRSKAKLAIAEGDLEAANTFVDTALQKATEKGLSRQLPELMILKVEILNNSGKQEEAFDVIQRAHKLATAQKAYPLLWKICGQFAEIEKERGNFSHAQGLKEQARVAIDFIADHAGREELRDTFLANPRVQAILLDTGEVQV